MKRALPSYEDLAYGKEEEEGEIIESLGSVQSVSVENYHSEDEELGLKTVLPVGKFNERFKEGDTPVSGEEYLCTVRSQRNQMARIIKSEVEVNGKGIELKELYAESTLLEIDVEWAERYWKCYQESEKQFLETIESTEIEELNELFRFNSTEMYKKLYETNEIEPNMAVLGYLRTEQELTEKLINHHRNWLESLTPKTVEERSKFATWLQALIMCLDARLTSPQISNLRQLTRNLDTVHPEFKEIVLVIAYKYAQGDLIKINKY